MDGEISAWCKWNGDKERSAQRKLRVRYCNGDEERQPVGTRVHTSARIRIHTHAYRHAFTMRNVDTVKVQWSADWLSLWGSLFRGIIVNRMTEALGHRPEGQTRSIGNLTNGEDKGPLSYLLNYITTQQKFGEYKSVFSAWHKWDLKKIRNYWVMITQIFSGKTDCFRWECCIANTSVRQWLR